MAKKSSKAPIVAAGNKNVIEEAKGANRKKGGKACRKTGGKVIGLMTGGGVRPRLDRPGRKSGGGVGANTTPLSTAHGVQSVKK
jgi:hypothetical protein